MLLLSLVVVVLCCTGAVTLLNSNFSKERERLEKQMSVMTEDHREQRVNWERERERLLNRMMVKEWTSYVQLQGAQVASPSDSEPNNGMSDDEEILRRFGPQPQGLGEDVLVDFTDEFKELGLNS